MSMIQLELCVCVLVIYFFENEIHFGNQNSLS